MQRLKYLDGLKGLGCFGVFLCHYVMVGFPFPACLRHFDIVRFMMVGDIWVCVFLIASAYGMAASIDVNKCKSGGVKQLILKRYLRLAVPIAMMLVVIAAVHYSGLQWNVGAAAVNGNERLAVELTSPPGRGLLKSLFLSPFSLTFGWLTQGWMLKYIFFGTFITLALSFATEGMTLIKTTAICVFFGILFKYIDPYYINMFFGYWLYAYLRTGYPKAGRLRVPIAALALSLTCALWLFLTSHRIPVHDLKSTAVAIAFMLFVAHSRIIERVLETRFMVWLGKISFSLYLLHMMLLVSLTSWLYLSTYKMGFEPHCAIVLLSTIATLLLVSWLSQKLIETRLSNTIINRIMRLILK